jgi:quercetin dioxygenase-like cupin family protein
MNTANKIQEVSETAAMYAVGNLSEQDARRFEQRIQSGCSLCIAELDGCQMAVEDLLLSSPAVAPPAGLEARLFEKISQPRDPAPTLKSETKITRADEGTWRDQSPGVQVKFLKGKKTLLVKMEAGATFPTHAHHFDEQCIVMEGSIQDSEGNIARAGDFVFMVKGSTHPNIFTETGALFLVAYT